MAWYPHFCGGRILVGLYNHTGVQTTSGSYKLTPLDHEAFLKEIESKHRAAGFTEYAGYCIANHAPLVVAAPHGGIIDPFHFVPNELETFKEILRRMTVQHYIGVISCVTNGAQTNAAKHLEACGFQPSKVMNKTGVSDNYGCIHWTGDWHREVAPKLGVEPFHR